MTARSDIQNSSPNDTDSLFVVGRIWRAHGVRGEVKIIPETDDPERLRSLETLYLGDDPDRARPYKVTSLRFQQTKKGINVIVALEGVEDRGEAETLRKLDVFAHEDDLPPLADEEFFVHDVVGLEVMTEDGETVGRIKDIWPAPAHDVYVVQRDGRPDALVPAVEEFVVDLDPVAERVVIRPIEGLLD